LIGEFSMMNLREGTRRLALLLGAVGAILGGFASYAELQTMKHQMADHKRFERLANSQIVRQERENAMRDFPRVTNPPITDSNGWQITVNSGGIATIFWGSDFGVASIETEDGQKLYPIPAPSAWLYLLVALFPVLGFFIPWGAVRAIGWVLAGFLQPSK
jgi:hypothetical protein